MLETAPHWKSYQLSCDIPPEMVVMEMVVMDMVVMDII